MANSVWAPLINFEDIFRPIELPPDLDRPVCKRAMVNAFDKSGADPGSFNKFATQWSQGVDPRAFALGDMAPAERSALFSNLQGQQRANFLATVRKGNAANVISKNDLQGATSGQ